MDAPRDIVVKDIGQAAYLVMVGFELVKKMNSGFMFKGSLDDLRRALVDYASSTLSSMDGTIMGLKKLAAFPGKTGRGDSVLICGDEQAAYLVMHGFMLEGACKDGGCWFIATTDDEREAIGQKLVEYNASGICDHRRLVVELRSVPSGPIDTSKFLDRSP